MATNAPIIPDPIMIDSVIGTIQEGLIREVSWLDVAYGRAQRITKVMEGRKVMLPSVYAGSDLRGNNDYIEVTPDSNVGNYCFFWVDDPQQVKWVANEHNEIKVPFALIVWFDLRRVYGDLDNRNTEALKNDILTALNSRILIRDGRVEVNRIYELAENIFRGFSVEELDNQYLMHPYGGFRFEGVMTVFQPCNPKP